ncbi:hypothetical protein L484_000563 [Morus notabilis]|uniref:Uncharacterized protein n=1 Tax=Morus notabilis TaxID=981085 RepID=W9SLP4_9ROSA|nr:hypothetical protein L484_000563 [Morus notabilis]
MEGEVVMALQGEWPRESSGVCTLDGDYDGGEMDSDGGNGCRLAPGGGDKI